MSKKLTITTLTGTSPFDVYLCDGTYNNCIYIDTITSLEIPYTFIVPISFENLTTVGVKVIDNVNCVIKNTVNI
jgi:hypothetical protein